MKQKKIVTSSISLVTGGGVVTEVKEKWKRKKM